MLNRWCFRRKNTSISSECLFWRGDTQTPPKLNNEHLLWAFQVPLAGYLQGVTLTGGLCVHLWQALLWCAGWYEQQGGPLLLWCPCPQPWMAPASPSYQTWQQWSHGISWFASHWYLCPINELIQLTAQMMLGREGKTGQPASAGAPHYTEWRVTWTCTLTCFQLGAGVSPAMAYVCNQKVIKNSHWQVTRLGVYEIVQSGQWSSPGSMFLVIFPNPVNLQELGEG